MALGAILCGRPASWGQPCLRLPSIPDAAASIAGGVPSGVRLDQSFLAPPAQAKARCCGCWPALTVQPATRGIGASFSMGFPSRIPGRGCNLNGPSPHRTGRQQPALFPHLSVTANVAYGLAGLDRTARAARVEEMLGASRCGASGQPASARSLRWRGAACGHRACPGALPSIVAAGRAFFRIGWSSDRRPAGEVAALAARNHVQTVLATHDATDAFITGAEVALVREGRLIALGAAAQVLAPERDRLARRLGAV